MNSIYITAGILVLSLLGACSEKKVERTSRQQEKENDSLIVLSPEQAKNAGIETGHPQEKELSRTIRLYGTVTVSPQHMIGITFPLGGYVREVKVVPGMRVGKGDRLAVLEDLQYIQLQQDYLNAREKYSLAEKTYRRYKELNRTKASSDKLLEQAETERETQRINMASLAQKLRLIGVAPDRLSASGIQRSAPVRAPESGVVTKVNVHSGKYVASSETLFEIINTDDIMLTFKVFEKDVSLLKEGQEIAVYSNNNPEKKYKTTIAYLNRSFDRDRAVEVICRMPEQQEHDLLPGLFVNADLAVKSVRSLVLPEESVVSWKGKSYVYLAKGNYFEMVPVTTEIVQDGWQQVSSEKLSDRSEVVVKNAYALLMKAMNREEE
ncbi:efflux RND transporter periplasmic adaptor subunit [Sinomicrobium soli]|uniref:efflux RND transporter periplasmic adaptor subunit n=1 Tax=Sinomicrobium sp. N-1-3-6 TaxID=2219864 RepID=UPI000DCB800A|nr:efflux RND transporter periplasmic adaptor subunit [Sinomicrobium sp. N-1-3-6]RAV27616.1 efflux transporter periplasmic adaptor subunit [Sinomicrobium sp. N-1-3-6]